MGILTPARIAILALTSVAGQAAAQSFNIEVGNASGTVPSSSFGAAAGVPGTWNSVVSGTAASIVLKNLDGTTSAVTMTHPTSGSFFSNSNANLTGDYANLLSDVQADNTLTYSFTGLSAGQYCIYTYALDAHSSINACHVAVNNAQGVSSQDSGFSTPTSNDFHVGGTHSLHTRIVNAGDTVSITVTPVGGGIAQLAGIQIVRMGSNGTLPRFYVSASATGDNGGRSWANGMNDLQDALECTRRIGSGNEIWIRGGSYKPTTGSDRTISFPIPSGVQIYGGFVGTETTLAQRGNPLFSQTILTGAINGGTEPDNSYCVVDASGTGSSTLLDGFTVAHGYGNGAVGRGGGMLLDGSFATLRQVRFISNQAGEGGAVGISGGSNPKFVNCYFYQNSAFGNGGAVSYKSSLNQLKFVNCTFLGNTSDSLGGAIATSGASINAVNCLFSGNQTFGFQGGAAYLAGSVSFALLDVFTNCSFSNNKAPSNGGAIYGTTHALITVNSSILFGDICNGDPASNEVGIHAGDGSTITYVQSTVAGKAGVDGQNPLFVDANGPDNVAGTTDDNLRLQHGSPCVDIGSAATIPNDDLDADWDGNTAEQLPIDLDANPRRSDVLGAANGAAAGSPPVDRGCYETQMPPCPADINDDGIVDLLDFFAFFNAWDISGPAADVNLDGTVDLADFFDFFDSFDVGC